MNMYVQAFVKKHQLPKYIKTSKQFFDYMYLDSPLGWLSIVEEYRKNNIPTFGSAGIENNYGYDVLPYDESLLKTHFEVDTTKRGTHIEEKPEMIKNTLDKVVDQNKEAAILSAELGVGRAANEFLAVKLAKTLPWYKRMFLGNDALKKSWLGKLVVAQLANGLIQHTSSSDKLKRIGNAMLKESMVDATVYSDEVTALIKGLESAVSLPQLNKIMENEK